MSILQDLLRQAVEREASDIHIKPDGVPFLRVRGTLMPADYETVSGDRMANIVEHIVPEHQVKPYRETHEADFSVLEEGVGRFRVNVFQCQGRPVIAIRHVKDRIPTFEELHLPMSLKKLADIQRGIVILAGTTGSGKSTTLAALIGEMNRTQRRRIITIEDPVEYLFKDDQCIISQREVGLDTREFDAALERVWRQDPDVILIGEMRNQASIRTALLAAATGHLVLSTLHAGNASMAVPRMLDVFPRSEQDQILMAFAETQHAVICQRLVPDARGSVTPAVEIMFNTPTVRKLLEKRLLDKLSAAIETGGEDGMQTFDQSLYELIKRGQVTEKEAFRFATNPEWLRMNLRGIFLDESRRILS